MELDDIKWALKTKLEEAGTKRSAGELEQLARRKTMSVIAGIKRSMLFELVFGALCMTVFIWACYKYPYLYVRFFCTLTIFFCIVFIIYLVRLFKRINFFEKAPLSVKDNLQHIIDILQRFTTLYFQFSMLMLPVIFLLGLLVGYLDISQQGLAGNFHWTKGVVFYAASFIGWSVLMYFFTKWYIKKLYGNYLQQLKHQLSDLENG
jgi:hypothetical protein